MANAPQTHRPHLPPTANTLQIQSHSPRELADVVIASFLPDDLTDDKPLENENAFVAWTAEFIDMLNVQKLHGTFQALQKLEEGARIANRVFFLGALDDIEIYWEEDLQKHESAVGITYPGQKQHPGDFFIFLEPQPNSSWGDDDLPFCIISTLMHEMCHAMLMKFSCENDSCGDSACRSLRAVETRNCGHGNAWWDIAEAIEIASPDMFGIALDLGTAKYDRTY